MNYILMGDIINSREKDAKILWLDLNQIVESANNKFGVFMLSPLEVGRGDELQVIMKDIKSLLDVLLYLNTYFMYFNIEMRFVIGYAEIESIINKNSENNMLGRGLTETHDILNNKKNKNRYRFYIQEDKRMTTLLNTIGNLLTELEKKVTQKQYEYLYNKIVLEQEIAQIAIKMNVTPRSIYNYEEKSNYKLFQKTFSDIQEILL